jgi:hypothetical protein
MWGARKIQMRQRVTWAIISIVCSIFLLAGNVAVNAAESSGGHLNVHCKNSFQKGLPGTIFRFDFDISWNDRSTTWRRAAINMKCVQDYPDFKPIKSREIGIVKPANLKDYIFRIQALEKIKPGTYKIAVEAVPAGEIKYKKELTIEILDESKLSSKETAEYKKKREDSLNDYKRSLKKAILEFQYPKELRSVPEHRGVKGPVWLIKVTIKETNGIPMEINGQKLRIGAKDGSWWGDKFFTTIKKIDIPANGTYEYDTWVSSPNCNLCGGRLYLQFMGCDGNYNHIKSPEISMLILK